MSQISASTTPLAGSLRQMLALLESERQALAGLDLEQIITCASGKLKLSDELATLQPQGLDEECEGLLNAVRRLNEINRRLRNMIADSVQARLGALTGTGWLYSSPAERIEMLPR